MNVWIDEDCLTCEGSGEDPDAWRSCTACRGVGKKRVNLRELDLDKEVIYRTEKVYRIEEIA